MVSSVQGRKKGEGQRTLSLQAWPLAPASSVRAGSLACPKTHHGPRGKRVLCLALMNQNSSLTAGLRICPPGKMGSLPTPVGSTEQEVEGYWVGNGQDVLYLKGIDSNFGVYKMGTLTPPHSLAGHLPGPSFACLPSAISFGQKDTGQS